MGVGGLPRNGGKTDVSTENSQMTPTGAIFTSKYHTGQLNPWQNDQPVLWQITANYQLVKGRRSHLKITKSFVEI